MSNLKKYSAVFILSCFLLFSISSLVFAQSELEVDYPEIGGIKIETSTVSLPQYVKYIFNFAVAAAGIIAFSALVYAGFRYFTSGGNASAASQAKERIGAAALGLLIILASYLILSTINPQLVFLDLPELIKVDKPDLEPFPSKENILTYTEIPAGELIAEMLSATRMSRIKSISENIKNTAEEIKDLVEELNELAGEEKELAGELAELLGGCGCQNTSPNPGQTCAYSDEEDTCPGAGSCQAAELCLDEEGNSIRGDMSAKSREIEQKKTQIKQKEKDICYSVYVSAGQQTEVTASCSSLLDPGVTGAQSEKGLIYWQNQLEKERNGSPEENLIGIEQVYQDLEEAETLIKNCYASLGPKGNTQELLTYNDFEYYQQSVREEALLEPVRPWDYIRLSPASSFRQATLFCAEQPYSSVGLAGLELTPEEASAIEQAAEAALEQEPVLKNDKNFCGEELQLGQAVDDAEDLAKLLIEKMRNLNQKTQSVNLDTKNIINSATLIVEIEDLQYFIDEIKTDQCVSSCSYDEGDDCSGAAGSAPAVAAIGEAAGGEEGEDGDEDADEGETCSPSPPSCSVSGFCAGLPGTDKVLNPKIEISSRIGKINSFVSNISSLADEVKNNYEGEGGINSLQSELFDLIDGEVEEKRLKILEIFSKLRNTDSELRNCYNNLEEYQKSQRGEKVTKENIYGCSQVKDFLNWGQGFYSRANNKVIDSCYGSEIGKPDQLNNYFCCQLEVGF